MTDIERDISTAAILAAYIDGDRRVVYGVGEDEGAARRDVEDYDSTIDGLDLMCATPDAVAAIETDGGIGTFAVVRAGLSDAVVSIPEAARLAAARHIEECDRVAARALDRDGVTEPNYDSDEAWGGQPPGVSQREWNEMCRAAVCDLVREADE